MPNVFVVADTHFNHSNIISYENRPYENKDEMNEDLIKRWNESVAPEDTVYFLGDFCFGGRAITEGIVPRLNGYKVMRKGNHDQRSDRQYKEFGFDEVYQDDIQLDGVFALSHYPIPEEELDKLIEIGVVVGNVHGHVHSSIEGLDQSKYKCVSVELTNYRPLHIDEVYNHFGITNQESMWSRLAEEGQVIEGDE